MSDVSQVEADVSSSNHSVSRQFLWVSQWLWLIKLKKPIWFQSPAHQSKPLQQELWAQTSTDSINNGQPVSMYQYLGMKVAVWMPVWVQKSRLQEKLGHLWGSGEVSPTQPPVLFHCLARLACVLGACACDSTEGAPWAFKGELQAQEAGR